jgi:hypothetical protein
MLAQTGESHLELVNEDSNRVQLVALILALHYVSVSLVVVRRVKEWMAWYRTRGNVLLSQPARTEGDVEGCWQWDWAVVWKHAICLADVLAASMFG